MRRVESVNVGRALALTAQRDRIMPAVPRQPVVGPVAVQPLGLAGDAPADADADGSVARAVFAYPVEHHPFWQTVRAQAGLAEWGAPLPPAAFGENLALRGLVETQAFVGDLLRFPDCTLAVSAPHEPGPGLDALMGFAHAARLMTQSAWCGYWLAVRVPGSIAAGQDFELVPGPREVGIAELFRARTDR